MSKYECPICSKDYNNSINQPYILKCGDTICSKCINYYENEIGKKTIECPVCCNETESTGIINKFVLLSDNKEIRIRKNMDRGFNIKNLKLIKQIKGTLFEEITLLKDKRLCSIERDSKDKRNLTIYDKNFNSQIEIKSVGELYYPQTVASLEPDILAYKSDVIKIIELEGDKYSVIQTIDHSVNASLYSFKNLLVFSAINCNEESGTFAYKRNSFNKYELEEDSLYCYDDYQENHFFNGKEFNIYCNVNHPTYGIEYNGKRSEPSYFTLYYPNQILFIEPSFIILGEQEFLFDLNDPELKIIEKNPIIHDTLKNTVYPYKKTKAYVNISKNSFLYLNEHLYQFDIINEKSFKLITERKDIKGFDLILNEDILIIATPGEIMIYKFCD